MQCKRLVLSAALNHTGTPQQKNTQHYCAAALTIMLNLYSGLCIHFVNTVFWVKVIIHNVFIKRILILCSLKLIKICWMCLMVVFYNRINLAWLRLAVAQVEGRLAVQSPAPVYMSLSKTLTPNFHINVMLDKSVK